MRKLYKILVVGVEHHNTYSLIRCFGEEVMKVDLILYGCSDSYIGRSIYIDNIWYCKDSNEAIENIKQLVNDDSRGNYVVITATDAIASMMDLQYDEFLGKCNFFNAGKAGMLTHYMDKEIQSVEAMNAGLKVPITSSFSKGELIKFFSYPCIIKPLASIDGGKRLAVCKDQSELEYQAKRFADVEKILVQQYLTKNQEIVLLGVAAKGEVLIPGYIIKYRDVMGGTTYSSTAPIADLDVEFVLKAKQMVVKMNYEGLFGIEFIRQGKDYYFIEINLRNDATTYALAVAGANLPYMYFKAITEIKSYLGENPVVRSINSMVEIVDFKNVLHRKIGLLKWIRQRQQSECRYFYDKEDLIPYRLAKKEFLFYLLRLLFHR